MKILMLNYEYPPLGGGAANANRYLLEELKHKDVEIDLVTSSPESYNEKEFSDKINIYKLNVGKDKIHYWKQIEILRYMLRGYLKSLKLMKSNDYDLIHAWFGFPCGLMAKFLGLPYIVALQGSDVPGFNERFSLHYKFLTPIFKSVWASSEVVISNSAGLKEMALGTLDRAIKVIPNGVDTSEFEPGQQNCSENLELLCVSRFTPRKRISDIIKAIQDLDKVKLTLVGEGKMQDEIKAMVHDMGLDKNVEFKGYVAQEKLPDVYRQADVFVIPSLNEGMSNTVLEAMASGLPIITTQIGGTEELIRGNGVIVPKKDPERIREEIIRYRNDPERLVRQSKKSRDIADQMSWKNVADKYYEIYSEIV